MKLVMCDVCKKVLRPHEMYSLQFNLAHGDFIFKHDDEYDEFETSEPINKDICFDCMVNVLKPFYPQREILTKEECDELKRR